MAKMLRLALGLACLLSVGCPASSATYREQFSLANEYYEQKKYANAIETYQVILESGVESAALYFNLGNAYFKEGDLGHAVLYYLRAKRLDPSDEDIRHNLQFAQQFSSVKMEGVQLNPIQSFFVSLVDPYPLEVLAWLSSGLFILFLVLLVVRYGLGTVGISVRVLTAFSLVLLVGSVGLTTLKYRHDYLTRRAVIITEEAPVQTGPSDQSDLELQGAPGLVVEILDESGDYLNVLFENKRRGWIKRDYLAVV